MSDGSLDQFFYARHQADLSNCDREPVHLVGSVQSHGAMLVVEPKTLSVVACSTNLSSRLGRALPASVPFDLRDCFPEAASDVAKVASDGAELRHVPLETTVPSPDGDYQPIYHEHRGFGFLELIPAGSATVADFHRKLRRLRQYGTRVMAASTFEEALHIAAEAGRDVTGFARVKIYEFQPDWSGKVVAEAKADHMPSFLGMFFPESDIPKQARYLMQRVPYRGIATVDDDVSAIVPSAPSGSDAPLDLSWSVLRSVSKMHTQYLRNMGVQASFSASLIDRGELWGLIACHHDQPGFLPFDMWGAMQDLATVLMTKLEQDKATRRTEMVRNLRAIESEVADVIRQQGNIELSVAEIMPRLRTFLRAGGVVFQYGSNLYSDGEVPPDAFIHELLDWAISHGQEGGRLATDSLAKHWPRAAEFREVACGVLIEPINQNRICDLIWFRPPVLNTVRWAGDPKKKDFRSEADGTSTLLPRNSFATWVAHHTDQSEPWTESEIEAGREILKNMLEIVASQLQLVRTNRNLETFSYAAAHDLKTPLRHIRFVLDALKDVDSSDDIEEVKDLIQRASRSSDRLQSLIDNMMKYMVLEAPTVSFGPVCLETVVADVRGLLERELESAEVRLVTASLPEVLGDQALLTTLLLNLVGNAIKYREPSRRLEIIIEGATPPNRIEVSVVDNGQGIPREHAEKVFEPLKRLHRYDDIPGTGLGLAICKRIAEIHRGSIRVDLDHQPGARFVVQFKK